MAEKGDKPKKSGARRKAGEESVLGALPSTRGERIGTRRASPAAAAPKTTTATAASNAAATPAAGAPGNSAKPGPKATAKPAAKPASEAAAASTAKPRATPARKPAAPRPAAKPRATATRRKAATPRTFEPTPAAEAAAGAADERAAGAAARDEPRTYPRPRPVREGAPGIGTTGRREPVSSERGRPSGTELVSTAVQAAGELAQLGLTIGGQIVKRAVDRLPKP